MTDVSTLRCNVLRAMYLLMFAAIPFMTAAHLVYSARSLGADDGWAATGCLLAALALLSILGLRHPVRMIPLLLLELLWKAIWMARVALPLFLSHHIDDALVANSIAIGSAVILLPVIPWRHVVAEYLHGPAEPWRLSAPRLAVKRAS